MTDDNQSQSEPVPRSSVPGVLWPALSDQKDSVTLAILGQLLATQWWSPETILKRQLRQLTELVSYTAQTVPFYRERLQEFARPKSPLSLEDWHRIPILSRRDIQEAGPSMVTRRPLKDHGEARDVQTSGSTGEPVTVKRNAVTGRFFTALTLRDHMAHRRDFSSKIAYIRRLSGDAITAAKEGKSGPWVSEFPSGPMLFRDVHEPLDETLEWLAEEVPDYLMTYPTYLGALIRRSEETGMGPARLQGVVTFGEVVDPHVRKACQDRWGVSLADVYSTQEVGIIAFQCPGHDHYLVQAEGIFVEVLDDDGMPCAPGETGRVVVTPLHNFSMPLIRYEIGDYAEVGDVCPTGRGLPVLTRILGRTRNMLITPEGERVWASLTGAGLEPIEPIRQFQVFQNKPESIDLRLVVTRHLTADEETQAARAMVKATGYDFVVNIVYLDEIPRSAGGKYEDVISELAD